MVYRFIHYFPDERYRPLTNAEKLQIAKSRAAEDLAKELMRNAVFEITDDGNVRGQIKIGGEG